MSERSAVQNPMLKYAQQIGWEYVNPGDALGFREGDTGLYFNGILEAQLVRLNSGVVDLSRTPDILRRLKLLKPTIEGNREAHSWLRGEQSVFVPDENRERNVKLIDFEKPENNLFHVTDEWWQKGVVFNNRADVVFLINGMPVALAELKDAGKQDGLALGVDQIRRYHRETPEMFVATQVFEVTQLLDFFYGVTWSTSRKNLFNWRDEQPGNYESKVKAFFNRPRFLRLVRDYVIFMTENDELTKKILRQHQTRAVEKVIERVADPAKRRGLVWHTQGSGKTLTMLTVAAKLLREVRGAEKPTVLMLIDRNELEGQLLKNADAYGIKTVRVADSKKELQEILGADYRGLVVSMIHKFDGIPANINARESVVILVDEAHRTTGGDLGNYLMGALPNATYIGFTGTPVDRLSRGQGTFKVFGSDDAQGYLDKYSIQNVYEVVSPDAFLRQFIEDYLALAELYALIRAAYGDRIYVDREVSNKTRELLQQHTITGQLEIPGAVHTLGPEELAKLKDSDTTDTTKILNLRKILVTTVQQDGLSKPFLLSIGERAEKLVEAYEDRQVTTQQALLDFERLAREVTEADVERQKLGLDPNTFAIYKTVSVSFPGSDGVQAKALNALFDALPDYRWNKQQESKLRTELYKALRPLVGTAKMIDVANQLLRLQRV